MNNFELRDEDLKIETYRSSGKGGQNVNKTESAVRITHVPTGLVVSCQNERSQSQNKEMAKRILKTKLIHLKLDKQREKAQQRYDEKGQIRSGNQIRSYVLHPDRFVKDHRTGLKVSNVEEVLDGNLDAFVDAYLEQRLK